jgi:chromosomal replication initiation ATPase DnaA
MYQEIINDPAPRGGALHELLGKVAQEFGVTAAAMRGPRRCGSLPSARAEFCRRAWMLESFSSPQIGRVINRDHTIVLYYVGNLTQKPGGKWNSKGTAIGPVNSRNTHDAQDDLYGVRSLSAVK